MLSRELCNMLVEKGIVNKYDIMKISYANSRLKDPKSIDTHLMHNISPTLDTRCDCFGVAVEFGIRKLTPKECFRLMGVHDDDYEKVAKNQSNASLWHMAGDSIVVDVLMAIFKQML